MKFSDISPAAAMLTGEGAMGKLMAQGVGGVIPTAIARDAQKKEEDRQKLEASYSAPKNMKKGGTASSRADGCCVKGKTKGRMI
jgi:hypothetical protein